MREEAAKAGTPRAPGAVIIQPLEARIQIRGYRRRCWPVRFTGVFERPFSKETRPSRNGSDPLMLSVLLLTCIRGPQPRRSSQETELEQQVWTDYVARGSGGSDIRYLGTYRTWLSWLAQQMRAHQQTVFYAEYLQEELARTDQQRTVLLLAARLRKPSCSVDVLVSLMPRFYRRKYNECLRFCFKWDCWVGLWEVLEPAAQWCQAVALLVHWLISGRRF